MILVIDNHSRWVPKILEILKKLRIKYDLHDQRSLFRSMAKHRYKGVILSGGMPDLDLEIKLNSIRANIACLINYDIPTLGICEGHEIIGFAGGGEINRLKNKARYNDLPITIHKQSKIFKGLPKYIHVYEAHEDYLRDLPKEHFEVAASSRKDVIESFFHKKRPIFGVQFHPEKSGEHGEKIIKNFIDICGGKR